MCFVLAAASGAMVVFALPGANTPLDVRVAGVATTLGLCFYWLWGLRRRRFPLGGEALEAAALLFVLSIVSGHPLLPLCGLLFRSLYPSSRLAVLRGVVWAGVLLLAETFHAHSSLGSAQPRVFALVVASIFAMTLRRALAAVEESEKRLASLIEHSTDVVTVLSSEGWVTWQAASARDVLGIEPDAWLGTELRTHVYPRDRGQIAGFIAEARGSPGASRMLEVRLRHGNGTYRWFEIAASNRLHDPSVGGFVLNVRDATDRRQLEDERNSRVVADQSAAVQRAEVARLLERIEAEHEKHELQERLQRAQRLEAVGTLAGGIAHDFNNLLTVILNYVSFVRDEISEQSQARADLDQIGDAAERGSRLIEQLLAFGQRKFGDVKVLDIDELISGMRAMLDRPLGRHIELVHTRADSLWPVEADQSDIEQIVLNLVVNARDAIDAGGQIALGTANVELTAADATAYDMLPGRYVHISVRDDGCGIDATTLAHVWEPFFTTKPPGEGTGLGLATVYGIAQQAGGGVAIASDPGNGTQVDVYLPASDDVPETEAPPAAGAAVPDGRLRRASILLVDDEPPVREAARRILQKAGYDVSVACGGNEALELLERKTPCDLLITDAIMPGMWGDELADRVQRLRPGIPALFISGYSERFLRRGRDAAPGPVLTKPFRDDALLDRVAELLARRTDAHAA